MLLYDTETKNLLSGVKRKNPKSVEQLEKEVRSMSKRIEDLEREMKHIQSFRRSYSKMDAEMEDDFELSDGDNSSLSITNDSVAQRTRSGKLAKLTDLAYLYSVPLVREEKSVIKSMGLPIDHNTEIDDLIEGLETTGKSVNVRMDIATIDSFTNLLMIKPKVVHLSCHGDFDKETDSYYLAFESKKVIGMMEKLSLHSLETLLETQKKLKSIE